MRRRSILWLRGVRRAGKTSLAQSLADLGYFDCELPRVRRAMQDPESFLMGFRGRRIVLDEIHRLPNPSELLKIAADHFPTVRIRPTGSSTLGASRRFRDNLAGRKTELWLTPMIDADLADFGDPDLPHRLLKGGLPPFFLSKEPPERDFQEWMDAYRARDIQELFRLERRASFQRFAELRMAQSGGIFEATKFAAPCEVSRTTITNPLAVLEATSDQGVIKGSVLVFDIFPRGAGRWSGLEELRHVRPGPHAQPLRDPHQRSGRLLPQSSRHPHFPRIPIPSASLSRIRPAQCAELLPDDGPHPSNWIRSDRAIGKQLRDRAARVNRGD